MSDPSHGIVLVTGTDTGVGKTVAATWTASVLAASRRTALVKAVQTGTLDPARDGDEAFYRAHLASGVTTCTLVALPEPLAPSIAAVRAHERVDVDALVRRCREIAAEHDVTLVEGAGGLLVPIDAETDMADLALELGASLMLVIRPALGTLNHTMLSVEAAERRGLAVEMLVCSDFPDDPGVVELENLRFLRARYPSIPLLVLHHADLGRADALDALRPRLLGDPPALLDGVELAPFELGRAEG